jgi:hypothetical protein
MIEELAEGGSWLNDLEASCRLEMSRNPTKRCTGEAVYYSCDIDSDDDASGTVICVGANYGQGTEKGRSDTHAKLGPWRRNYTLAARSMRTCGDEWRERGWLSGNPPLKPRTFIMTNIVPWITDVAWSELSIAEATALVDEAAASRHLEKLAAKLPDAFAIAHGIDVRTFPHVRDAVKSNWDSWMLYANLSFPWLPSQWNGQRFTFRRLPEKT